MLNELIKQTNALAREMERDVAEEVRAKLTEEFNGALARTLKFVSDNNVPLDTVSTIEDRIVREQLKKRQEDKIRADAALAKSEYETAKKDTDFLARGVNSGMGNAELRYLEMKARMDDFQAETAHMTKETRMNNVGTFNALYAEYLAAKSEYEKVGNSDAQALVESLKESEIKLSAAEAKYDECKKELSRIPLKITDIEYEAGTGAVTEALKRNREEWTAKKKAEETVGLPTASVPQPVTEPQSAADMKTLRDETYAELDALKKEIVELRAETAELKRYISEAKAAVTTIEKARQAAVVSAKRAIAVAERTEKRKN